MKKIIAAFALLTVTVPAFAQQPADPVNDVKDQWRATMITGQANLARSVDALISAYQISQIAVARGAWFEDACKSTPECGGVPPK